MTRVLVTGGAGYIGSHTVRQLVRSGHEVVVYDDLSNGHPESIDGEVPLVLGDLCGERLPEVFDNWAPEAIIHFAAAIEPGLSGSEPARFYRSNIAGTIALADEAAKKGIPTVFSSSCAVYGTPDLSPVDELAPRRPESFYGETKAIGEDVFTRYDTAYGMRHIALRYFNAAGADPSGENGDDHRHRVHLVTVACLAAIGLIDEVEVFGNDYPTRDGTCLRDYVHVCDLATAHLLALEALLDGAPSSTYNVGTGSPHSVLEVIEAIEKYSHRHVPRRFAPRRSGDPAAIWADGTRIRSDLGWRPELSDLSQIIETAWRWHEGNPAGFSGLRVVGT